jgi:hypothetical protein
MRCLLGPDYPNCLVKSAIDMVQYEDSEHPTLFYYKSNGSQNARPLETGQKRQNARPRETGQKRQNARPLETGHKGEAARDENGAWVAQDTPLDRYSTFFHEGDFGFLESTQLLLTGRKTYQERDIFVPPMGRFGRLDPATGIFSEVIIRSRFLNPRGWVAHLFGGDIITERSSSHDVDDPSDKQIQTGIPKANVALNTHFCSEFQERLEQSLSKAGQWRASVNSEGERSFRVMLKSHSSKEFFYRDGYWWKAFLEISFTQADGGGNCSGASIYLYDSVVCAAPIDKDPDANNRRECFFRIEPTSNAEFELQDRIRLVIQKMYGVP